MASCDVRRAAVLALIVAILATLAVADTWRRFSQTFDEPFHIVGGLEWLERGTYRLEVQHPPLARIFEGLGLVAAGRRLPPGIVVVDHPSAVIDAGNAVLNEGDYQRNLILARAGVLPFFLLALFVVWTWTKRVAGREAAAIAVVLYATLPPALAHAGLATTDMAVAATAPAAIVAFLLWRDAPSRRNAIVLAIALAAAVLSKFSAIPFCAAAMLLNVRRVRASQLVAIAGGACVLIWAAYHFTLWPQPIFNLPPPVILAALAQKHDLGSRVLLQLLQLGPLPAPEFFTGLAHLSAHAAEGHRAYLLGEVSTRGWWLFFPIALGVKTPLPFLLLAAVGLRREPALAAAAILAVAMVARIDIGIRHILPVYAPLAVCAGAGAWRLRMLSSQRFPQRGVRALVAILLTWQLASCALAHPDYLAWFNEAAGSQPDRILVDSNLDWGQDLPRLRDVLRENHIDVFWLAYFGSTDLRRYPLVAQPRQLPRNQRVRGWIAISRTLLAGAYEGGGYAWLRHEQPVAEVGKSMLLYYVR